MKYGSMDAEHLPHQGPQLQSWNVARVKSQGSVQALWTFVSMSYWCKSDLVWANICLSVNLHFFVVCVTYNMSIGNKLMISAGS